MQQQSFSFMLGSEAAEDGLLVVMGRGVIRTGKGLPGGSLLPDDGGIAKQ